MQFILIEPESKIKKKSFIRSSNSVKPNYAINKVQKMLFKAVSYGSKRIQLHSVLNRLYRNSRLRTIQQPLICVPIAATRWEVPTMPTKLLKWYFVEKWILEQRRWWGGGEGEEYAKYRVERGGSDNIEDSLAIKELLRRIHNDLSAMKKQKDVRYSKLCTDL